MLPAATVVSFLSGSAQPDTFTHVLRLRIVVPEALRRPSGRLLRLRQSCPSDVYAVGWAIPPGLAHDGHTPQACLHRRDVRALENRTLEVAKIVSKLDLQS